MKRYGLLFMVVFGLATVAWAGPNDVNDAGGRYDANDLYPISDANDIRLIDANDYGLGGIHDLSQTSDPNAADLNDATYLGETSGDSNAAQTYDDSNIHSVYDIIDPIRLAALDSGATQSLAQGTQNVLPTLSSLIVSPASPTSSDTVTATFAGRKGANYVVDHVDVSIGGSLITLDVQWRRDALADGPTVDYSQPQSLGTLSVGTYTLQVRNYYGGQPCASIVKFFTVSASGAGAGAESIWDRLTSHLSKSNSNLFATWPSVSLLH